MLNTILILHNNDYRRLYDQYYCKTIYDWQSGALLKSFNMAFDL